VLAEPKPDSAIAYIVALAARVSDLARGRVVPAHDAVRVDERPAVVDCVAVGLQPAARVLERLHGQRVELTVGVRAVADLHLTALRDDIHQVPDDEGSVDVVRGLRIETHVGRPVINHLPVARDASRGKGLLGGAVVAV